MSRRLTIALLASSVLLAAYTGFRMPSTWSATLQSVSFADGFHRRFAVGTLLHPFAAVTDYDYRVFAAFSFVVIAVLLGVIVRAAIKTVAAYLGNTPAVCRASYVDPRVIDRFHAGTTIAAALDGRRGGPNLANSATRTRIEAAVVELLDDAPAVRAAA